DDVDGALRAHHGDLGGGPGEVDIPPDVLAGHHVVGPAVGLAGDHGELRHGRLAVRVQKLRAVPDDPAVLLPGPRHEPGHIDKRHKGDVERVTEPDEPGALDGAADVERAGQHLRLLRHDAGGPAVQPRKAGEEVPGEVLVHLEKLAAVDDAPDDLAHVVRAVGILRDDRVQGRVHPVGRIRARDARGTLLVVLREVGDQPADQPQRVEIMLRDEVRDPAAGRVDLGAAEVLGGHVLVHDGFDDLGTRDE